MYNEFIAYYVNTNKVGLCIFVSFILRYFDMTVTWRLCHLKQSLCPLRQVISLCGHLKTAYCTPLWSLISGWKILQCYGSKTQEFPPSITSGQLYQCLKWAGTTKGHLSSREWMQAESVSGVFNVWGGRARQ